MTKHRALNITLIAVYMTAIFIVAMDMFFWRAA